MRRTTDRVPATAAAATAGALPQLRVAVTRTARPARCPRDRGGGADETRPRRRDLRASGLVSDTSPAHCTFATALSFSWVCGPNCTLVSARS